MSAHEWDQSIPYDRQIVAEAVAIIERATAESAKLSDTPNKPTDGTKVSWVGPAEGAADGRSWRDQDKYSAEFNRLTGATDEEAVILTRAIHAGWGWTLS